MCVSCVFCAVCVFCVISQVFCASLGFIPSDLCSLVCIQCGFVLVFVCVSLVFSVYSLCFVFEFPSEFSFSCWIVVFGFRSFGLIHLPFWGMFVDLLSVAVYSVFCVFVSVLL